jgi:uncharacterized RDD family membrane protein YckC
LIKYQSWYDYLDPSICIQNIKEIKMEKTPYVQAGTAARQIKVIGFGRRLAATLIDGIILFTASFLLALLVGFVGVFLNMYAQDDPIPVNLLVIICGLILSILYYVVAWSRSGQTIAKSVLGIKVVGSDGKPLSVGKALLRYLGYILSAIVFSIGFLWVAFDKKRQGWHDKIASSYAIDGYTDLYGEEKLEFVPENTKPGWLWLVIWFLIAIVAPPVLVSTLLIMGPTLSRIVTGLLVR